LGKSHYEKLPSGWAVTSLGEVVKFINGRAYRKDELLSSGKYKVLRVGNFFTNNSWYYSDLELEADKYCDRGDLLYAWSASFGAKIWDGEKTIFHYHIWKLEFDECLLNKKFLYYFLEYDKLKIMESTTGSTMIHVSMENMMPRNIFIPPLSEQCRIVNAINAYMSYIDNLDSAMTEISAYVNSAKSKILDLAISGKLVPQDPNDEPAIEALRRINPGFKPCDNPQYEQLPKSWAVAKIGDVYTINPRNSADDKTEAGFVPMTNIHDGYNNSFSFELRNWGAIKTGFTHFRNGDIVVAKISPCLENRKSAVISGLPNGIGAGTTELHVFRQKNINPLYGLMFFKTNNFIQSCTSSFNGAVGQQRVSTKVITDLEIPIPPIAEQQRIVDKVNELFTILDGIQNSLDAN
jgi:type I restriction enzyme S subunit